MTLRYSNDVNVTRIRPPGMNWIVLTLEKSNFLDSNLTTTSPPPCHVHGWPPSSAVREALRTKSGQIFDRNGFRSDILAQPWTDLMGLDNPNEMWLKWKSLFLEVCDVHAPLRTKHARASKSPWITSELKKLMYRRDRLKIKALRTSDPSDWSYFKKLGNEVNNSIKNVKIPARRGKLSMRWPAANRIKLQLMSLSSTERE